MKQQTFIFLKTVIISKKSKIGVFYIFIFRRICWTNSQTCPECPLGIDHTHLKVFFLNSNSLRPSIDIVCKDPVIAVIYPRRKLIKCLFDFSKVRTVKKAGV